MKFVKLVNIKMPTIVAILTFVSMLITACDSLEARKVLLLLLLLQLLLLLLLLLLLMLLLLLFLLLLLLLLLLLFCNNFVCLSCWNFMLN